MQAMRTARLRAFVSFAGAERLAQYLRELVGQRAGPEWARARRRMARMRRLRLLAVFLLASPSGAGAVEVLRCTAADGSIVYQDRPCASGQAQQTLQLPDDPPPPAAAEPEPAADAPALPDEPAPEPPVPAIPAPGFVLCTRADGSRYISDDGFVGGTGVPYGMLAGSGRSLAETYGGRQGVGISAPGVREVPRIPAGQAPFAGAQVWIADECHHARAEEACAWLGGELARVRKKLEHAFSDVEPQLKQEQAALLERMRGCR